MRRLRTTLFWSAIAALVIAQTPGVLAKDGDTKPPKPPKVDREILQQQTDGARTIHVIVRAASRSDWTGLHKTLRARRLAITHVAPQTNAFALTVSASDLTWLETLDGLSSISIDAPVTTAPVASEAALSGSAAVGLVRKSTLRAQLGLTAEDATGRGIGIAVLDSGIAPVSDLAGHISAFYDFSDGQPGVATAPVDGYGHGTHIAGLIAGSGGLSGGQYSGVAPEARLIGLRVLNNAGTGTTSDVIAAIEFAIDHKKDLGLDILNLSIGHPVFEPAATDPLVQAVEAATRAGLLVVVAAGNAGVNPQTNQVGYAGVLVPGNAPSAITVASAKTQGTVDVSDDRIANYSSRGPSWIDGFAKPDVAAPGQDLAAPAAPGSYLATTYPALLIPDSFGRQTYLRLSGTSMAAAVETGLLAVTLETSRPSVSFLLPEDVVTPIAGRSRSL